MKMQYLVMAPLVGTLVLSGCNPRESGQPPPPAMVVPVRTAQAVVRTLDDTLSTVGTVIPNEVVELRSETDGMVESIGFQEGQAVTNGQILFLLDQGKAAANLAQAQAGHRLAEANAIRSRTLFGNNTISRQEFDQAQATFELNRAAVELMQQQFSDSVITAPFDGVAGARLVSPGQVISRNTHLSTIVSMDPIKVELRVPERYLGQLSEGQEVVLRAQAYPGEVFRGQVFFIDPQLDLDTRTVRLKAMVPNPLGRLRPGMFSTVDLVLRVKEHTVVVPENALVLHGDRTMVWIVDTNATARIAPVDIGVRLKGETEILSGLQGGETVIVEGTQKLRPGAQVSAQPVDNAKGAKEDTGR